MPADAEYQPREPGRQTDTGGPPSRGMIDRRRVLAAAAAAVGGGLAGCLGDEPVEFAAEPVGVAPAARESTGYGRAGVEEQKLRREVEAAGRSREVVVTNYRTEYDKAVDLGPAGGRRAALFTVLSTPQVELLGREFNPVAELSTEELVERVQEGYDGLGNVEHDDDAEVRILGQSAVRSRFTAEAEFDGVAVDVVLHVTEAVEAGDDLVVTVGVYPRLLAGEGEHVVALMRGVDPDAGG